MDTPINARTAILAVLMNMKDKESYGLEIIEEAKKVTGGVVTLNEGSVYPALRAMEKEGLLVSFDGELLPERGGRPRRYYRLTGAGKLAATTQRQALRGLLGLRLAKV